MNQDCDKIHLQSDFVKCFRLTRLQKEIIKLLVLHNRLSAIRLSKFTNRHYESVWRCLKNMENKGLVQVVENRKGITNRFKKLFTITATTFQGLLSVDPDLLPYFGAWIYTVREVSAGKLVEALIYKPEENKLTRVIIPLS